MKLAVEVDELSKSFSNHERLGLASQIQQAAASVPSNIAEGHTNGLPKPFLKHLRSDHKTCSGRARGKKISITQEVLFAALRIAAGSVAELETQCLLALK